MLWLARAKRDAARALGSRAFEADGFQTSACWWLSVIVLVGMGFNTLFGWWWAEAHARPAQGNVPTTIRGAPTSREPRTSWEQMTGGRHLILRHSLGSGFVTLKVSRTAPSARIISSRSVPPFTAARVRWKADSA